MGDFGVRHQSIASQISSICTNVLNHSSLLSKSRLKNCIVTVSWSAPSVCLRATLSIRMLPPEYRSLIQPAQRTVICRSLQFILPAPYPVLTLLRRKNGRVVCLVQFRSGAVLGEHEPGVPTHDADVTRTTAPSTNSKSRSPASSL